MAPLVIGGLALLALILFDLGPPLAFNDDWLYAWLVRRLLDGHGLHAFPEQAPPALVQTLWAALLTLGHPDQRLLRLTAVPFVLLAAVSSAYMARRLGANRFWAVVAGVSLVSGPIFLGASTSFMTEPFFIGLLMAAAAAGVAWLEDGRGRLACVLLTGLTCLERQYGAGIAGAMTVAFLLRQLSFSGRPTSSSDWRWLGTLWAAVAAGLILPVALGLSSPVEGAVLKSLLQHKFDPVVRATTPLPGMLGFLLLPFAVAVTLPGTKDGPGSRWGRRSGPAVGLRTVLGLLIFAVGLGGIALMATHLLSGKTIFPGNEWSALGLNPPSILAGTKPDLFSAPVFATIEAVCALSFVVLALGGARRWAEAALRPAGLFLIVIAVSQFLPMLERGGLERYYLPVAAPLLPLAAAIASHGRSGRGWAIATLAVGLVLYAAGQQDYEAWQSARDQAAHLAYRTVPPANVWGGYETFAVYVEIPVFERTGNLTRPMSPEEPVPTLLGPLHITATLQFARRGDPRPGYDYSSLASGRIVVAR